MSLSLPFTLSSYPSFYIPHSAIRTPQLISFPISSSLHFPIFLSVFSNSAFRNPHSEILVSPHLLIYRSLPPVPRHLPNQALSPKLTVKFRIGALAAIVDIETLAALSTEPALMFLTDSNRLSVRMISTLHLIFSNIHSRLILP